MLTRSLTSSRKAHTPSAPQCLLRFLEVGSIRVTPKVVACLPRILTLQAGRPREKMSGLRDGPWSSGERGGCTFVQIWYAYSGMCEWVRVSQTMTHPHVGALWFIAPVHWTSRFPASISLLSPHRGSRRALESRATRCRQRPLPFREVRCKFTHAASN